MNEKFVEIINRTGKSVYVISKETGIPYTTLNELVNGKVNINKCNCETVFILSLYLKQNISDILNDFSLIDGVSGKYKGVKYYWRYDKDKKMELHVLYNNNDVIIDSGSMFSIPKFYGETRRMTELLIDYFLDEQEALSLLYG